VPILPTFRTLRARLVALLLIGVILPLSAIGWWTTRAAVRSARSLLQSQLDTALDRSASDFERRWKARQSDVLILVENEPTRRMLVDSATSEARPAPFAERAFAQLSNVNYVVLRDARGRVRWTLGTPPVSGPARPSESGFLRERSIVARIPVTDLARGDTIGSVEATLTAASLLPGLATEASQNGPVSALRTPQGDVVIPAGADDGVFSTGLDRSGRRWLVVRRAIAFPALEILIAGALDPVLAPFEHSANVALVALLVAAGLVTCVVLIGGRRITSELELGVIAAEAVASGDLDRRLPVTSRDEVGRLAGAFNAMTESLRRTLDELTRKEALAAVGEFASELAHEVRNPLTSMRLDLQRMEEEAEDSAAVRALAPRLLRQVDRLERAVSGALRVARGNRKADRGEVNLVEVLQSAMASVKAEFDRRHAIVVIDADPTGPDAVDGDAGALEQVFVNLLVNAAHAMTAGGEARITIDASHTAATIRIRDTGIGMNAEMLDRLAVPFHSSKRDGTGLGLKIARRIVHSHGGTIEIESQPGVGTCVTVVLPRLLRERIVVSEQRDGVAI
jgi:two-component system sensor histidine kinase AtoS